MTGGNAQYGRRDNGLYAAEYAVVGDVDPRIGEHLLDVLGNRGIAAYLQPSSDQHPITRLTMLPSRPTDRLFVDRSELTVAREFLAIATAGTEPDDLKPDDLKPDDVGADDLRAQAGQSTGERSPAQTSGAAVDSASGSSPLSAAGPPAARESEQFEAAWASIVAGFDSSTDTGTAPWPANEDLTTRGSTPTNRTSAVSPTDGPRWPESLQHDPRRPESPGPASSSPASSSPGSAGSGADGPSLLDGLDSFGTTLPDDEEEDYYPPAPPPLPRLAWITIMGILGVIAGVAIIANPDLLPIAPTNAAILGGACLVAGAVALIGRLRPGDDDEPDDPDDGAVV